MGEQSPHFAPRLGRGFYDVECVGLAKKLLGKILVRRSESSTEELRGKIVETEAYLGGEDLASHTHHGKMTERTAPAFADPGSLYIPPCYGMYHLLNISSQGEGATVLIRALEPLSNIEGMQKNRSSFGKKPKKQLREFKVTDLCNGPSKLAISMDIDRRLSGDDLVKSPEIWIEGAEEVTADSIVECPRIGVDFAGHHWASQPLRFYILGNSSVSKRDKKAEEKLKSTQQKSNI